MNLKLLIDFFLTKFYYFDNYLCFYFISGPSCLDYGGSVNLHEYLLILFVCWRSYGYIKNTPEQEKEDLFATSLNWGNTGN